MSTPKTHQVDFRTERVEQHRFGVTDRLGREIGIDVYLQSATFVPFIETEENKWRHGYAMAPGRYFRASTQTTRDGTDKQAAHQGAWVATADEALAAAKKTVEGARKRAMAPAARKKA